MVTQSMNINNWNDIFIFYASAYSIYLTTKPQISLYILSWNEQRHMLYKQQTIDSSMLYFDTQKSQHSFKL